MDKSPKPFTSTGNTQPPIASAGLLFEGLINDLRRQCCGRTVRIDPRLAKDLLAELEALSRDKKLLDRLQELYGQMIPAGDYRAHLAKIVYEL